MASHDPEFEAKAADNLALYLNPSQHAAVFYVDEKSHIRALGRLDPLLPFSPGRLEHHGFEYYHHGTPSLLAAINTKTGEIVGQTVPQRTSLEFVAFLGQVVARGSRQRETHILRRVGKPSRSVPGTGSGRGQQFFI